MKRDLLLLLNVALMTACGSVGPNGSGELGSEVGDIGTLSSALGTLSVAPVFASNMVLQRDAVVPVFGAAAPGASVTVEFQGQSVSAVADAAGAWAVTLAAMPASSAPSELLVFSDAETVILSGVQVGEVWLCSGQSNMGRSLSSADGSAPYIADAGNHNLRFFRMHNDMTPSMTTWQVSSSTTAANFSAVCYWMALDLSEDLNVPIGLIQASYDGSAISEWEHSNGGTGAHYDAMVRPFQPLPIKSVLWYQGESNGGDSAYERKLTDMIAEWRSDWASPDLPFGIVQLPATKWAASRIGQFNVSQQVADTYLVVITDLPGASQLHPTAKYLVGIRSSIGARGVVYGEPIEYSGPVPDRAASYVSGSTAVLNFTHLGDGLVTTNGLPPGPFEVAGSSGRFVSATATLVGNTIEVTSSRVSAPTSVRYAFGGAGNVANAVNIPTEGGTTIQTLMTSLFQVDIP